MAWPGFINLRVDFSLHLGGHSQAAGIRVYFEPGRPEGIHFKSEPKEACFKAGITKGIEDGIAIHSPGFLKTGRVVILEVEEHEVDSSQLSFYWAGRLAVEQAASLKRIREEAYPKK